MQKKSFFQRPKTGFLKKLIIMKLLTMFLLIAVLQARAGSYSQNVTISLKNVSIERVFKEIQKQSDYLFFYNEKLIRDAKKITINVKDVPVQTVLQICFKDQTFSYAVDNKQIVIKAREAIKINVQELKIPMLPPVNITGKITDAEGNALPSATIKLKGSAKMAISDANGKFSLQSKTVSGVLEVSYVGYETREVAFTNEEGIVVALKRKEEKIEEVVVIGYGTQKKSDLTGSVSSLKSEAFNKGITTAPQQLMQGKIAGVNINLNSGEPGANSTVIIRGGTSISASNRPLYVIDGVPIDFDEGGYIAGKDRMNAGANNPLNLLSPADIKSIDVLKDASATAIYGSRGANGVIIISTKQGKSGKSAIEYSSYVSVSSIRKKLDVLSGTDFRNFIKKDTAIKGWIDGGTNTDWQDQIFRKGISHSHDLSFSGGDNKTSYRASVSYGNQEGIIITSALEKIIARVNINHKALNDKLNITLNLTTAQLNNNGAPVPEQSGGSNSGGIIGDALRQDPTYPVKDANGVYTYHGLRNLNPVEETYGMINRNETFRFLGNVMADYKLFNYLSFSTNVAFTKESADNLYYANKTSRYGEASGGYASQQTKNTFSKLIETNLNFNKKVGDMHAITALAGYSYQEFFNNEKYISASKFISDATTYNSIGSGDRTTFDVYNNKESNKLISFYGRANYQYNNRYLATITVRRDGSSRFGNNNKWGTFPSAALAWKVSEEGFLTNSNLISNLKLRVGYGVTGNQEIGNYLSLKTLSPGGITYVIGGTTYTAVGPNQNQNPDLKWESTSQTNVGVDFGFFKNRLTGSVDYYTKKTSDLLLNFDLPSPAEVTNIFANVGEVRNKGLELELKGIIIKNGPLTWDAFANISHNKNKVVAISNKKYKKDIIYTGSTQTPGFSGVSTQIIKEGEPLNTFFGYQYTGVLNGIEQFLDVNKDGKILPGDDRVIIGTHQPNITYGFGSSFGFKRLNFDFSFYGINGNKVLNATALDYQNITALPLDNIASQAITDGIKYGEKPQYSSRWIQDASFLRLENITLGYDLNVSSIKWLSKANIYLTGQNLFVATKYTGFDPEISSGTDHAKYPRPRTILLGFNVQF